MIKDPDRLKIVNPTIDLFDEYDVQLWALVLGASEEDVAAVAREFGPDALAVQAELKRRKHQTDKSYRGRRP